MAAGRRAELGGADRDVVLSLLAEFGRSWQPGQLPDWVCRLPPLGEASRRAALVELVKFDLEQHWRAGQPVAVESYLEPYPELASAEAVVVDLVLTEYEVRRQLGPAPDLAEYVQRFPHHAAPLRARIARAAAQGEVTAEATSEQPGQPLPEQEAAAVVRKLALALQEEHRRLPVVCPGWEDGGANVR